VPYEQLWGNALVFEVQRGCCSPVRCVRMLKKRFMTAALRFVQDTLFRMELDCKQSLWEEFEVKLVPVSLFVRVYGGRSWRKSEK